MKKILALTLTFVLLVGLLSGCSGQNNSNVTEAKNNSNDTVQESTGSTSDDKVYTIKVAHGITEKQALHMGWVRFKEIVEEKSNGKMLINLLLLFVGCFMDTSAAIIILAPILLPIVTAIGVDPVHFAIIMVVNLSIGFLTPPLGTNLFVACNIRNLSLEEISIGVLPFVITMIIVLMLLTYIPGISLTLPRLFMS